MLINYLKIAIRSLLKNKAYTIINIFGLAVGLACCILIMLHVRDELSYDDFHPNADNIYRMALERVYPDYTTNYAIIPSGFSEVVKEHIPGVRESVRLVGFPGFSNIVTYEDVTFEENYIFTADSSFFDVFPFRLIRGDHRTVLKQPQTVILTETIARKYFGEEDPMGKTLEIDGQETEVVGVMEDIPSNSHLKFDFLQSGVNQFFNQPSYTSFSSYTYLLLEDGVSPGAVESAIPALVNRYAAGQIERELGLSYQEYVAAGNGYNYFLQPIRDIHLHSSLENEIKTNGNIMYVYLFISISIFILVIAGINFVNLATARSTERAKEVGVRKVMGSDRSQLIGQFLAESIFISLISLAGAVMLTEAALPVFNSLAQKNLTLDILGSPAAVPLLLIFALVIGLLAGLYPAFYISSLKPTEVMKGKFRSGSRGRWLRNALVVFQFAISIILISGTLVVYNQLDFIQNTRLGFDKENVLLVERANSVDELAAFKRVIRELPDVKSVAGGSGVPGGFFFGIQFQQQDQSEVITTKGMVADDHFVETTGMNMLAGRSFSELFNDSLSVILNEAAVSALGIENPVGTRLITQQNINDEDVTINLNVIGVVENFNFESLHTSITPLAIMSNEGSLALEFFTAVRYSGNATPLIRRIENIWKEFSAGQPFTYSFLDSELAELYRAEQSSGKIFGALTLLAILIACVGLFGLAAYTAYQRTKEIGVRKVFGASVPGIVLLLSKDFSRLIVIAFIIAVPISWILIHNWLENFAYRVELNFGVFLLAGFVALVIAWLTVSYKAVSAAMMNPAKSLRNE